MSYRSPYKFSVKSNGGGESVLGGTRGLTFEGKGNQKFTETPKSEDEGWERDLKCEGGRRSHEVRPVCLEEDRECVHRG